MKQCKCEHWQTCPICYPKGFDAEGNRLPPEPTPLQAARARVEALERERDHNLDSINVGNAIINKKNERIAELEAALDVALEALDNAEFHAKRRVPDASIEVIIKSAIAKLKEVRPTPQKEADQRAWEWQNQHHIRRQFEDDDFQPGAI